MECVMQCEIDSNCRKLLDAKWPDVPKWDDVRSLHVERGSVDLICGGSPCQDVSVAGNREGLAGERSGLWFEYLRILDEARPEWFIFENVPGLLSSAGGRDFATILRGLVQLGYRCAWRVLDAQHFGVPQRRRRVFIVGHTRNGSAASVLFESEGMRGNPETGGKAGQDVAYALRANPSHSGDKGDGGLNTTLVAGTLHKAERGGGGFSTDFEAAGGLQVAHAVRANPHLAHREDMDNIVVGSVSSKWAKGTGGPAGDEAQNLVAHALTAEGSDASEDGTGRGTPIVAFQQNTRDEVRLMGGDGQIAGALSAEPGMKQQNYLAYNIQNNDGGKHKRKDRPNGGMYVNETDTALTVGTTDLTAVAWTIRGGKEGGGKGYLESDNQAMTLGGQPQWVGVRRLTPRECSRLQGFPDGWTEGFSDSARYRMLGNAVAVPVVEWIARRIALAQGILEVGK